MRRKLVKLFAAFAPIAVVAGLATAPAVPAMAQGLFETVITVNDQSITRYEIEQRARMLSLFRAPGNPTELAREQLIEDRLKLDAAQANGIVLEDTDVQTGMEEFAGRVNMDLETMIRTLAGAGVDEPTYREFVRAGVSWREVTQARFARRISVSESDLERARAAVSGQAGVRVLLSEIIMPIGDSDPEVIEQRATRISEITSEAAFSAEARKYSATASRERGGRLDWQAITDLPPVLRSIVLGLAPGEVSEPLPIQGAVALFQLRDIEELETPTPEYSGIEYAAYYIDGGRSEQALARAAKVKADTDTCDDLYGIAQGQPESVLDRGTKAPEELPTDIALELSKLDPGEVSTALTRANGQTLVFLMLCGRTPKLADEGPSEADLTGFIRNQRLESFSNGYLEQLRAEARIIEK
ncbi:peptidylprolyl isomerase [uncultured Roseovarius sp.]|uniref:peptidylprolyl isomerase n=1 Tax=uncultured Roseovarius sp. TaxID=293344 RepID=UPI002601C2F6|nr:peptidylprolyl isomerase [uncultured Roseovarius sp.]